MQTKFTQIQKQFIFRKEFRQKKKEENFNLIKASAIHLWAQTYYGTWRINKNSFDVFENKEKAIKTYHLLETIRLDEKIKKELPGVGRILDKFNPKNKLSLISKEFAKAIDILSKDKSSYKDSLNLINSVIKDLEKIPESIYAGNLKLDSVVSVSDERKNQDKINFEKALEELHEQWKVKEAPEENKENENSNEKTFSIKKEDNNNEYDVAIEFGDNSIKPPENIKQLMDSIIQDFGEIPEEYLEPAGDGGYSSNDENEEKNNSYNNENFDFCYNEWDHATQKYRKDWCKLNEKEIEGIDDNFIQETLNKHRGLLKNLNRTFEALRQDEKS